MQIPGDGLLNNDVFSLEAFQSFNWASTPLGDRSGWPEELRLAVEARLGNEPNNATRQNIVQENEQDEVDIRNKLLLQKEIEKSERKFRNIVAQAPVAITILQGIDFVVELANDAYLNIIDRPHNSFVGRPFFDSLPELEGQGIRELLTGVLTSGQAYHGNELGVELFRYGKKEKRYFNFVYHPLIDTDDKPYGIMAVANDITDQIVIRHQVEESARQFGNLIKQSPVAMTILRGQDMVIEMANDILLKKIWRRRIEEVKGKRLLDVFPELADQPFPSLLHKVYTTGIPHTDTEAEAFVYHDDTGLQRYYLDFDYAPLAETDGTTSGIIITVIDVTEKVEIRRKVEEAELRLRLANEAAQSGTFDWDLDNEVFLQSPRIAEIYGFNGNEQVTHQDFISRFHPEDKHIRDKAVEDSRENGSNLVYEVRIIWPDDSIHWVRTYGKVVFSNGKPSRMYGTVQDITREKNATREIEESEQRLRLATEASALGTFDLDVVSDIVIYSPRYMQIMGYNENRPWTRRDFYDHIHPADAEIARQGLLDALASGVLNYTIRIVWQDGSIHWVKKNGRISYNHAGEPVRMIGTLIDITEERNAITALKESELLFKIISSAAPVGLWLTDKAGNCVFVNRMWEEWTGETLANNLGAGWLAKVPQDDMPQVQVKFTDALINKKYFSTEFRLVVNNYTRWCVTEGYPFYNDEGAFMGFAGSVTDITDRKNTEIELESKVKERTEDLKRSEERHHKMIDEIQDYAILLLSREGIIQNWNKGAEKIKGYSDDEIIGKSFKVFYSEEDREAKVPEGLLNAAIEHGRAETEGWRLRKDGSRFWASVVMTALHDDEDNIIGFTKVTRDLTESKIVEEERIEQTRQLSAKNNELVQQKDFVNVILDSSVDIISVFDTEFRYMSVNRSFEELYKVSRENILGKHIIEAFLPEQTIVFREYLQKAMAGETLHGVTHKSPITNRHYESFFIPLKNDKGVYAVLAVAHDNTDILEASQKLEEANVILKEKTEDLQRANVALEKSNSELEQYAYVASHDLQEPLRKIRTYSGMLKESLKHKADEASMATLQKIISSATRMSNLIYDLLNFSRLLNPERHFEETPLNTVFENIVNDFELVIEQKNAVVEVGDLPIIEAVPLQMNQLFYNLLNNALKFSMEGRQPFIKINAEILTTAKKHSYALLNNNLEYVDITISDNGIGFSQQYAEQIFEVFKRLHTRQVYQGSGIGLALCRRIVLNHQGDIFAEGKENNGSVFHVILPLQQSRI